MIKRPFRDLTDQELMDKYYYGTPSDIYESDPELYHQFQTEACWRLGDIVTGEPTPISRLHIKMDYESRINQLESVLKKIVNYKLPARDLAIDSMADGLPEINKIARKALEDK